MFLVSQHRISPVVRVHSFGVQKSWQARRKLQMVLLDQNAAKKCCQIVIVLKIAFSIYRSKSQR